MNFFPRLAETKGATATDYGLIIGTNCLVAFIVTPFIGNHLDSIGVKFAFVTGILGGGACCLLSGFLEFFEPGSTFIIMSVLIRWWPEILKNIRMVSIINWDQFET